MICHLFFRFFLESKSSLEKEIGRSDLVIKRDRVQIMDNSRHEKNPLNFINHLERFHIQGALIDILIREEKYVNHLKKIDKHKH